MTVIEDASSSLTHVSVDYYDKAHKTILLRHAKAARIQELVRTGIAFDKEELLIHSLFTEQQDDKDGSRTYQKLKKYLPGDVQALERSFDFTSGSIYSNHGTKGTDNFRVEQLGVAVSLIVANRIFDLTEADWQRILPTSRAKTLDFTLDGSKFASTGSTYVEVEAKGSIVESADEQISSVSKHKKKIQNKKDEQSSVVTNRDLFGFVLSIPTNRSQKAMCWLLDPPGEHVESDPRKYKLLARMTLYLRSIGTFSHLRMLIALSNRIRALESVDDYSVLDELALVNDQRTQFELGPSIRHEKTTMMGNRVIGRVFPLAEDWYFFYGFDVEVFDLVANQSFAKIVDFRSDLEGQHDVRIDALLDERDFKRMNIRPKRERTEEVGPWFHLPVEGRATVTGAGRVAAFLRESNWSHNGGHMVKIPATQLLVPSGQANSSFPTPVHALSSQPRFTSSPLSSIAVDPIGSGRSRR